MTSEDVILQAPMSFTGSAKRLWRPVTRSPVMAVVMIPAICLVWTLVLCWYILFGLLLVPYRLIRRGDRKNKAETLRHRETLDAIRRAQSVS